jgi:hypothetical protein
VCTLGSRTCLVASPVFVYALPLTGWPGSTRSGRSNSHNRNDRLQITTTTCGIASIV